MLFFLQEFEVIIHLERDADYQTEPELRLQSRDSVTMYIHTHGFQNTNDHVRVLYSSTFTQMHQVFILITFTALLLPFTFICKTCFCDRTKDLT